MNDDGPDEREEPEHEREHAHEQERLRALRQYVATHAHLTDRGNAQRLVSWYGEAVRFSYELGVWL